MAVHFAGGGIDEHLFSLMFFVLYILQIILKLAQKNNLKNCFDQMLVPFLWQTIPIGLSDRRSSVDRHHV